MKTYAKVSNANVVENVLVFPDDVDPGAGFVLDEAGAAHRDDVYDPVAHTFHAPDPVVPAYYEIRKSAIRARFVSIGKWAEFKALLNLPENESIKDEWDTSTVVANTDPRIPVIAAALGLTEGQIASLIRPE